MGKAKATDGEEVAAPDLGEGVEDEEDADDETADKEKKRPRTEVHPQLKPYAAHAISKFTFDEAKRDMLNTYLIDNPISKPVRLLALRTNIMKEVTMLNEVTYITLVGSIVNTMRQYVDVALTPFVCQKVIYRDT